MVAGVFVEFGFGETLVLVFFVGVYDVSFHFCYLFGLDYLRHTCFVAHFPPVSPGKKYMGGFGLPVGCFGLRFRLYFSQFNLVVILDLIQYDVFGFLDVNGVSELLPLVVELLYLLVVLLTDGPLAYHFLQLPDP